MIEQNPNGDHPQIDSTAYIHHTAVIIGNVKIGKNVFVGPGAVVRADESHSSITIKDNCNVQDRVIIHALTDSSVLIENNTSLAHGCIIHGPCKISKNCFIGFGSVVFNIEIGEEVFIKHLTVVEGVNIFSGRVVESSQFVNSKHDAGELKFAGRNLKDFANNVVKTNLELVGRYKNNGK